jgi:hypothetical protein
MELHPHVLVLKEDFHVGDYLRPILMPRRGVCARKEQAEQGEQQ